MRDIILIYGDSGYDDGDDKDEDGCGDGDRND